MAERQSPRGVLEALFSHVTAVEGRQSNVLPPQWHTCSGALAALQVVGLISDEEASVWRERLDDERNRLLDSHGSQRVEALLRPGSRRWGDQDAKRAALEFLARTIERTSHHREALRHLGSATVSTDLLSRGYGAIEVLYAVGLLDDRERRDWNGRFAEVAAATMPAATRTVPMPSLVPAQHVRATPGPVGERSEPKPSSAPSSFSGRALRRVLMVQSSEPNEEARPRLIEFYDDGVVVDWVRPSHRDRRIPTMHPRIEVRDDVGTDYKSLGGGGGGFGETLRMRQTFVPAVPAQATTLDVQLDDVRWRIPCTTVTASPPTNKASRLIDLQQAY